MYNFSQLLADNIHEQLMKITTEGIFKYAFVLVYMLLFQHGDKYQINLHKKNGQGINQSVIQLTSLVRRNSTEVKFVDFIENFVHIVVGILSSQSKGFTLE